MAKGFKKSIENIFNKMVLYSIITAVITLIVGIVFLCNPGFSTRVIGIFTGIVILLAGLNSVYKYFHRDGAKIYGLNLVIGIIYIVLGALIIVYPKTVVEFVTIVLGIYILVNGASKVNYAIWLKKGNEDSWLITLVTGILHIIIGILLIFNPFVALTLTQLAGAFLIINSVLDLTDTILFKMRAQEIKEIFW